MTNLINLLAFDQSTSYTGVFAGTFDLDNPLKAPKVIYWGTVGRKRKKSYDRDQLRCGDINEIVNQIHLLAPNQEIHGVACEEGYTDPKKPLGGLAIKQAQGWIDGILSVQYVMPVYKVMAVKWRNVMWGKHGCNGTEQLKAYSIKLATANMSKHIISLERDTEQFCNNCEWYKEGKKPKCILELGQGITADTQGCGGWEFRKLNDHEADAFFIAGWLFNEIVQGRITI